MTIDQHLFCKTVVMDAIEELHADRGRRDWVMHALAKKLERVLALLRDREFVHQICDAQIAARHAAQAAGLAGDEEGAI